MIGVHMINSVAGWMTTRFGSTGLIITLFVVIIISCPAGSVRAKEFVVDQKNSSASDTNDGCSKNPWKTISHAAKVAVAGDSVSVRDGIYREGIEVANSGGATRMITFKAAGKNVIVKGSDVVTGWKLLKGNIWKKENWNVNSQQVFVDSTILSQIGGNPFYSPDRLPAVGNGIGTMKPGTFYCDPKQQSLYIWLKDGGNPNHHQIEASTKPWLFLVRGKNYIKLSGFTFQHSNTTAVIKTGWPAVAMSGDNCIAENNQISWCDFTGLGGTGNNLVIKNNSANYNGNSGMGFSGRGNLLDGNSTNFNNYREFNMDWHAGGMKNTQLTNSKIIRHTSRKNNGHGIWLDIDCVDNVIEASQSIENKGNGIFYEISENGLIKNNISTKNGVNGIYISSSKNCRVLNNLVYGNSYGIVLHGPRDNHGLINNIVENNIITDNVNAEIVIPPPNNNIDISKSVKDNQSDFNLIYNSKGKVRMKIGSGAKSTISFPDWKKLTGNDSHSIETDPRFENSSEWKLRPSKNSPVRGVGKVHPEVHNDIESKSRPSDRNDIGPFTGQ